MSKSLTATPFDATRYARDLSAGLPGKYSAVARRLPASGAVLEVGCSTGYFLEHLLRAGYDARGVEVDAAAAAVARQKGLPVVHGNVEQPDVLQQFSARRYDAVLLMDVLEHLVDPASTMAAMAALLRPGGRLLITGPNVAYWAVRRDLLFGRFDYVDAGIMDRTHLHFFTRRTWCALVEQSGLRVTHTTTAEAMLPLESRLRAIGVPPAWIDAATRALVRVAPTLFTVVFLLEAEPRA